jgi:hypothetical protein
MKAVSLAAKERSHHMIALTQRMLHTVLLRIARTTLGNYESCYSRYLDEPIHEPQIELVLIHTPEGLTFAPSVSEVWNSVLDLLRVLQELLKKLPQLTSPVVEVGSTCISFDDCMTLIDDECRVLNGILDKLFCQTDSFLGEYRFLEKLLKLTPKEFSEEFDSKGERSLEEYRENLEEFSEFLRIVQTEMPATSRHLLFFVSCQKFKAKASEHFRALSHSFLTQNKNFAMATLTDLNQQFTHITRELKKIPKTPEELDALKKYLEAVFENAKVRGRMMHKAPERFAFLEEFHYEIETAEFDFRYQTMQMPPQISHLLDETEAMLATERIRMIRELRANQRKLETDSIQLTEQVNSFAQKFNDLEMAFDAVFHANDIEAKLKTLIELQNRYNSHEK